MRFRTMLLMLLWAGIIGHYETRWTFLDRWIWCAFVLLIGYAFFWCLKEDKWR